MYLALVARYTSAGGIEMTPLAGMKPFLCLHTKKILCFAVYDTVEEAQQVAINAAKNEGATGIPQYSHGFPVAKLAYEAA